MQLCFVCRNTASGTAQRKGRPHDNRITHAVRKIYRRVHIVCNDRWNNRLTDLLHGFFKNQTILRFVDCFRIRPQQADIMALKESFFRKLHGKRQPSLPAQCGKQAVRLFFFNNPFNCIKRQWLNVNLICHCGIRHNGCRVRVHKHDLQAFLLECAAGLCSRIIEFNGLADDNRAGADNQNFFYLFIQRHNDTPSISN